MIEVLVVLTMMGVMLSMVVPSFRRSVETARADIALANLRGIWAGQRVYWIARREYAADLATLVEEDLVSPEVTASGWPFQYTLSPAGGTSFTVTATREAPSAYTGSFAIDETGRISGSLTNPNDANEPDITPPRSQ